MEGEQRTKSCETISLNGDSRKAADFEAFGQADFRRMDLNISETNVRIASLEAELAKVKQLLQLTSSAMDVKDMEIEELREAVRQRDVRHARDLDLIVANHATEIMQLEQDIYILESVIRDGQRVRPGAAERLEMGAPGRPEVGPPDRVWPRSLTPAQVELGIQRLRKKWIESEMKASIQKKPSFSPAMLIYFPVGFLVHLLLLSPLSLCKKKRKTAD